MSAPELAFPCTENNFTNWSSTGMSLRDYFAAQALGGLMDEIRFGIDATATQAYRIADAMMKARAA